MVLRQNNLRALAYLLKNLGVWKKQTNEPLWVNVSFSDSKKLGVFFEDPFRCIGKKQTNEPLWVNVSFSDSEKLGVFFEDPFRCIGNSI